MYHSTLPLLAVVIFAAISLTLPSDDIDVVFDDHTKAETITSGVSSTVADSHRQEQAVPDKVACMSSCHAGT